MKKNIALLFEAGFLMFLVMSGVYATDCDSAGNLPYSRTPYGIFYRYCDTATGKWVSADGLDGRKDESQWCVDYSNYWSETAWDLWDDGTLCEDLFYTSPTTATNPQNILVRYNHLGLPIEVYDDSGSLIEKNYYDVAGKPSASWSSVEGGSEGGYVRSSADGGGNLLQSWDSAGNHFDNYLDDLDRVVKSKFYNSEGIRDFDVRYCYDTKCCSSEICSADGTSSSLNLLCEVQDNSGKTEFKYDKMGRVVWQRKTIYDIQQGKKNYTLEYSYDSASNLRTITLPDKGVIEYIYNIKGDMEKIKYTSPEGDTETIADLTYNRFGAVETKTLGPSGSNSILGTFNYDEKAQLTSFGFDDYLKRSMQYDLVGNILGICYNDNGNCNRDSAQEKFYYNNLDMLTKASYSGDKTFDFTYANKLGDRSTKQIQGASGPLQTTTYNYAPGSTGFSYAHRLQSTSGVEVDSFGYDDNGNMISNSGAGMIYDSLNRMVKVVDKDTNFISNYVYDYTNKRIKKTTSEGTTFYIYNGNNVIYEDFVPANGCTHVCGNVDGDSAGKVDRNDLSALTDLIFGGIDSPKEISLCAANVDGSPDNIINYNDLLILAKSVVAGGDLQCNGAYMSGVLADDPTLGKTIEDLIFSLNDLSYVCGDVTGDGSVKVADLTYMIQYLFRGGPAPSVLGLGDVDGNGVIKVADLTYMIQYLFRGGPAPHCDYNAKLAENPTEGYTYEDIVAMIQEAQGLSGNVTGTHVNNSGSLTINTSEEAGGPIHVPGNQTPNTSSTTPSGSNTLPSEPAVVEKKSPSLVRSVGKIISDIF